MSGDAPGGTGSTGETDETEEIRGALGRVRAEAGDGGGRGLRTRVVTMLAITGPGLIVMVGDNDAGGVATYAQAGQDFGYSLLWVLLLLIPVLVVNQEMVVRLGAVTGVGHARLIMERFGRFWGWFSVGDLFVLNFLTIVTEFIGVSLAATHLGVSRYVAVPLAALLLIAVTAGGAFHRWERSMFVFIAVSLLIVPLTLLSQPHWGRAARDFVSPGIQGGVSGDAVLLVIAIVGTTVAPWQLFFQQSNVIDKRITPRFIGYERADTVLGSLVVVAGAAALMMVADFAVRGTSAQGHFTDAAGIADALGAHHTALGVMFAVILLDASIIGAAAVTLATSYAFGDVFRVRHSLRRGFREARPFYLSYGTLVLAAAGIVLLPGAPLGVITEAVQALAGLLLPSATVFLLLLCNDPAVLGPWVNRRWLNAVAGLIVTVLLLLSGTLMVSTVLPHVDAGRLLLWLGAAFAAALVSVAAVAFRLRTRRPGRPAASAAEKAAWRMPPLALLAPVRWSAGRRTAMVLLRCYLLLGALLLLVKAVRLGGG
ncbi:NRAMP family divalent metal transporter [Streptomyces sp. CMB-StM0423]|uniref:NRAMP family divalent metal transporter n=1 Tax=Streptomyces sp. CMB-StM0423 TaxID=2059884 RepID=UPI000C710F7A|nr:NRAMP family divalent metal transporter [Streptomyces sp. CMB-StM0423]AUH42943.1 manganese transporter [Streptomyces sp. CMB-StM0423]